MVVAEGSVSESKVAGLTTDTEYDSLNLEQKTKLRSLNLERQKSCGVSKAILNGVEHDGCQPCHQPPTLEYIECGDTPKGPCVTWAEPTSETSALHMHTMAAAWEALKHWIVYFRGEPIGTVAAIDKSQAELNYDQVFMRDFVPSALAFLVKGEPLIVKNFVLETARLQSREKMVDLFKLGQGVMPASFKVHHCHLTRKTETLLADFGDIAIGLVAPVDSGLWWILLLRAYTLYTFDNSLAESPHCQRAMHLILKLWLSEGFDTSPTLLCADGCSMIDRRIVSQSCVTRAEPTSETSALHRHTMAAAWEAIKQSIVYFRGQPIGTVAAIDKSQAELNYNQVSMRVFVPSALAFLMKGETLIVKNFLLESSRLQSREKMVDLFKLGQGVMPTSFKVHHFHLTQKTDNLLADFGEIAIGRVAPVDSANHDSRTEGVVKSSKGFVAAHMKTTKKRCRSAPPSVSIQLAVLLLVLLSKACVASASTRPPCEVESLADNIRLFCSSSQPSSSCCDAINAVVGSQDGKQCLCLVGDSPNILTMGFSTENLIRIHNLCVQHDDGIDCDEESNNSELQHKNTGVREYRAKANADEERPHQRDRRKKTHKSDTKHGDSQRNEASTKQDDHEQGAYSQSKQKEEYAAQQPQQHDRQKSHPSSSIISFMAGVIILLLATMLVTAAVLKYKRHPTEFRQLLNAALAAALPPVPTQGPVAAQGVQAPRLLLDDPQMVNGVPMPPLQAQLPLAVFPGPVEILSLLSFIVLNRVCRRL